MYLIIQGARCNNTVYGAWQTQWFSLTDRAFWQNMNRSKRLYMRINEFLGGSHRYTGRLAATRWLLGLRLDYDWLFVILVWLIAARAIVSSCFFFVFICHQIPIFVIIRSTRFTPSLKDLKFLLRKINPQAVGIDSGVQFSLSNFLEDILQPTSSKMSPMWNLGL